MHVLLTRAADDNDRMQAKLRSGGIRVSQAPLLETTMHPIAQTAFEGCSGLIATSRNALKALARSGALDRALSLPVFCVGPATAALARTAGFTRVIEGPGTAATLASTIAADTTAKGMLLHLTGNRQAYDLAADLKDRGVTVRSLEVYRTVAAQTLPEDAAEALAANQIDAVVLMSPATARAWSAAIAKLPIKAQLTNVMLLCLSQAVAETFGPDSSQKIEIASAPNAEQMLALVFRLAANFKAEY